MLSRCLFDPGFNCLAICGSWTLAVDEKDAHCSGPYSQRPEAEVLRGEWSQEQEDLSLLFLFSYPIDPGKLVWLLLGHCHWKQRLKGVADGVLETLCLAWIWKV